MKKIIFLTLLCLGMLLTACGNKAVIPPVELIEIPAPIITTTIPPAPPTESPVVNQSAPPEISLDEIESETIETTFPVQTETLSTTVTTTTATTTEEESETETTTEAKPKQTPWVRAYRSLLAQHCRKKQEEQIAETTEPLPTQEHDSDDEDDYDYDDTSTEKDSETEKIENQWFVLIYLNDDTIPELVILDEAEMELYCFDGKTTQLLLEDSYKTDAFEGQNVCYQPYSGYIASAFTTMGGGDGFTIYHFDELDSVHVQRYYFNNNENAEGEMSYNEIWDRAEEFEVIDKGYHDVSLGESWTHITAEMGGAYHLNFKDINKLTADSVPDIELNSESEQDPTEDEEEDE